MNTATGVHTISAMDIDSRVDAYTWSGTSEHLDAYGWAMFKKLLTASECEALAGLYADDRHFRSHIVMARHGFGRGEYTMPAHCLARANPRSSGSSCFSFVVPGSFVRR